MNELAKQFWAFAAWIDYEMLMYLKYIIYYKYLGIQQSPSSLIQG